MAVPEEPQTSLRRASGSSLERWFAAAGSPVRLDLARSGAPAMSVAHLLACAGPGDIEAYLRMSLDYGPGIGSERLRTAVSHMMGGSPTEVVVTHGAVEALLLACAATLGERDAVAVASPGYEGLFRAVEAAGGTARPITVWQPGSAQLDLSPLHELNLSHYAAVVVNSPHNPTGLVAAHEELCLLARRCAEAGCVLVLDHVSLGTLDPGAYAAARSLVGELEAVVQIGDVSKAFGLGGLRIGWCVTRCPGLLRRIAALRDITSLANSGPSQHLGALALENRGRFSVAGIARSNLETLGAALQAVPGTSWVPPVDGLVAFPGLPLPCPSREFADRLRIARRVSVTPGTFFGHDGHLRIGLGLDTASFDDALGRLLEAVADPAGP